uniref:Uncharacterized protein n=1 Tax=Globodera rostochiensis TaxID=31243 RepID=A0A914HAJ0_GLORO
MKKFQTIGFLLISKLIELCFGVGDEFLIGPDSPSSDGHNSGQASASSRDSHVEGESIASQISRLNARILTLEREKSQLEELHKLQQKSFDQLYNHWQLEHAQHEAIQAEFQKMQLQQCVQKAIMKKIWSKYDHTNSMVVGETSAPMQRSDDMDELVITEGFMQDNFVQFLLNEFEQYSVRFSKIVVTSNVHYEPNAIFKAIKQNLLIDRPDHQFDRMRFQINGIASKERQLFKSLQKARAQSPRSPQIPNVNILYDGERNAWQLWNHETMANFRLRVVGHVQEKYVMEELFDELELVKMDPGTA